MEIDKQTEKEILESIDEAKDQTWKKSKPVQLQKTSGTETPQGIRSFNEIASKIEEYLPNTKDTLKIMLAVATSGTRKNRVMIWLLLVGSPSSGKTDLVKLIKNNKDVMCLDNLTQNSFITGERSTEKEKTYDLLPLLNGKCLVIKDWTSLFSLDEKATKKIIGDWVNSYDKSLSKFSSRRGNVTYESEFSHVGCITPATLNKHTQYLNMIGPRFLHFIIPDLTIDQENQSFEAIFSDEDRSIKEKEAGLLVSSYLDYLNTKDISLIKKPSKGAKRFLTVASRFMAKARGIVVVQSSSFKDESGKDVAYYEVLETQIEQPWRAIQQLIELSKYLALVGNKEEVDAEELRLIREIVLSSMPADRANALKVIRNAPNQEITTKELSTDSGKSFKTSGRLLEELCSLGILKKYKGGGQIANSYTIEEVFKEFLTIDTGEFLSTYNSVDEIKSQVEIPFTNASSEPKSKSCNICGGTTFWKRHDGIDVCSACHPQI
jgi:hypothetical protein